MDKREVETQYDRFIAQLRIEVEQTFWLYNFFFLIESGLLLAVFTQQIQGFYLLLASILGLICSLYWSDVMERKNKWREDWLRRIEIIEKYDLKIPDEFRMWPDNSKMPRGLWRKLFLLPKGFVWVWLTVLVLGYIGCI